MRPTISEFSYGFAVTSEFVQVPGGVTAFLQSSVRARSIWLRPTDIGPLPDDHDHQISFEPERGWKRFSEPTKIEAIRNFEDVERQLLSRFHEHGLSDLSDERLVDLANKIASIADKRKDITQQQRDAAREAARSAAPLQRVAYYASIFLESQLFVMQERHVG